jgi:hypothetical protein
MMRAELGKTKAYKGEQVVLSYYLYTRTQLFNLSASKFPVLNGFLKEELDLPIQKRLDFEYVVHDGVEYRRALLASYALYPLQEGRLKIDSFGIKYDYMPGGELDSLGMGMLFGNRPVRSGQERSSELQLDVLPLPASGKPASFGGAVGDFTLDTAVDKYEVKANEAITLTAKIEGAGNASAILEPRIQWPPNVEIYDTKGRAKSGRGGVSEKVFEYVLIPRAPGKVTLPAVEFSYFNTAQEKYVTKTSQPIDIMVLEGEARTEGEGSTRPRAAAPRDSKTEAPREVLQPLLPPSSGAQSESANLRSVSAEILGIPIWRWLYWGATLAFAAFFSFVLFDQLARRIGSKKSAPRSSTNQKLIQARAIAQKAKNGADWNEVARAYDGIAAALFDALDETYAVGARSYSREVLEQMLVGEKGMPADQWKRVKELLEFAELVKYASSTGVVSEAQARERLADWVGEAEGLARSVRERA